MPIKKSIVIEKFLGCFICIVKTTWVWLLFEQWCTWAGNEVKHLGLILLLFVSLSWSVTAQWTFLGHSEADVFLASRHSIIHSTHPRSCYIYNTHVRPRLSYLSAYLLSTMFPITFTPLTLAKTVIREGKKNYNSLSMHMRVLGRGG